MNRCPILVPLVLLVACGHSLWPTTVVVTPQPVSQAFACVDSVATTLGYKAFQSKPTEGFLRTRKSVADGSRDLFDHQAYDQLKLELLPVEGGQGTTLTVTAESYTEQLSRRSREQVEKPARVGVIADARTVVEVCGTAQQPRQDRVPSVL